MNATQMMMAQHKRAVEDYRRDARFRAMATAAAGQVLSELEPDEGSYGYSLRQVGDVATEVAALLLRAIYDGDAELLALREENKRLREIAESALSIALPPRFIERA